MKCMTVLRRIVCVSCNNDDGNHYGGSSSKPTIRIVARNKITIIVITIAIIITQTINRINFQGKQCVGTCMSPRNVSDGVCRYHGYRDSVKFSMKARACCVRERSKLEVAVDEGRDVRAGEKVPGASTGKVLARDGGESMSKQSCQTGSVKPSFCR